MTLKHHIEQEIKLTAPNQVTLTRLLASPLLQAATIAGAVNTKSQRFAARYYDTVDWGLRDLRWSLRTRHEGEQHVCTLKRNSRLIDGLSSCEEIEQAVESDLELILIGDVPDGKISNILIKQFSVNEVLVPRVEVVMQRSKRHIKLGETLFELVTDSGLISANNQQYTLHEVELELLKGDLHSEQVQLFVAKLKQDYSLEFSLASKHQVGLSFYDLN